MSDAGAPRHPFDDLTPDVILDAVDGAGFFTDGRLLALNSFENRVYQVGLEDAEPVVTKFYRPNRWSDAQIREEHGFSRFLRDQELPVVAPLANGDGETLFQHAGFRFAVFPRQGGHAPELDNDNHLRLLGRTLARWHAAGNDRPFQARPVLDIVGDSRAAAEYVGQGSSIPTSPRPTGRSPPPCSKP
ncbi:Serine/threonine protein kinase RdoA [Alcanivorax sp. ALC70]|nr:Serine/threonine protein kinase RdoA [Alcanivorax sp. ALC70]